MKKTLKMISAILVAVMLMFTFAQPVCFADVNVDEEIKLVNESKSKVDTSGFSNVAGGVIDALWKISIVVTIIVIMVIGLKFILGSTQEKAEYKKSLIPIVVGVVLIVSATSLVKFLFSFKVGA